MFKKYEDVKDIKQCNNINKKINGVYKRDHNRFIDSFNVMKILLDKKDILLKPL